MGASARRARATTTQARGREVAVNPSRAGQSRAQGEDRHRALLSAADPERRSLGISTGSRGGARRVVLGSAARRGLAALRGLISSSPMGAARTGERSARLHPDETIALARIPCHASSTGRSGRCQFPDPAPRGTAPFSAALHDERRRMTSDHASRSGSWAGPVAPSRSACSRSAAARSGTPAWARAPLVRAGARAVKLELAKAAQGPGCARPTSARPRAPDFIRMK
jgi:hypothetical protein